MKPARRARTRSAMVEEFRRRQASGWVALRPSEDSAPVVLLVNGTEVARTQAAAPSRPEPPGAVVPVPAPRALGLRRSVRPRCRRVTIEQADHATGRSVWGVEDPDPFRIVARR